MRMSVLREWLLTGLMLGGLSCCAFATVPSTFQWRGFLNAGYAQALSDDTYLSFIGNKPNFLYDTSVGVAFSATPVDKIDVGGQFVAQGGNRNFTPGVDWANVTYRPNDAFKFQAGRLRFPMWLIADHYYVGYSYLWTRPPPEVYALNLLSTFFGVSARYNYELPEGTVGLTLYGGLAPFNIPLVSQFSGQKVAINLTGSFENLIGAILSYDSLKFRARASYANTRGNLNIAGSLDVLPSTSLGSGIELFTQTPIRIPVDGQYNFWSGGVDWRVLEWARVMVEYVGARFADNPTSHSGYASLGVPLEGLEPHFTFARAAASGNHYNRYAVGCNFPVANAAVLKLQWEMVDLQDGTSPLLANPGHVVHIVSSGFSVVF